VCNLRKIVQINSLVKSGESTFIVVAFPDKTLDNIKMDLREIRWDGMDWIDLTQDKDQWRALLNTVMDFRLP
jgi:hypothetical protein